MTAAVALIAGMAAWPTAADAQLLRTVAPGESLSSIAAEQGIDSASLAAANGMAADAELVAGEQIEIPEAAPPASPPATDPATAAAQGMVPIHHPSAAPYLAPDAAAAWEAMRAESLQTYGVDLYPIGSLSGYRTYEQQAYFYELYLAGLGSPANPPGSSSHETGYAVDVATPAMRDVVDRIGARHGWAKVDAPGEWWHITFVGGG
jgi:LAS superfamily LD-carboxypeptidase LdcB